MPEIRATYRLQLHAGFPLAAARELVPYLSRLGVTHIHCSPMLQARRGSTHGYDVVDPKRINPELGTEADLEALHAELASRGMGIVLDIVPNHMAASSENPAWDDVLAHGPASAFAQWFDIDWRATERELRSRVLLPILGDSLSDVVKRGEIGLESRAGVPRVRYFEHDLPLDPSTLPAVLAGALAGCHQALGRAHPSCVALEEITTALRRLPRRNSRRAPALTRRRATAPGLLDRLRDLAANAPQVAAAVDQAVQQFGAGGEGEHRLRRLLEAQVYRLVHWRRAAREINYRRFFDVDDLVALHAEDPEVFAQTHALVLEWRRRGWVDGLRIDHPDGLLDPLGYFQRLAAAAFPGHQPPPLYVEKILTHGETLRTEWPVSGTTGYDFLNEAEALFIDPAGYETVEQDYRRQIRRPLEFAAVARQGKRLVLDTGLSAGVRRLADRLLKVAGTGQYRPVVPRRDLVRAIVETIVALPVYRTYVDGRPAAPGPEDRRLLEGAIADARSRGRSSAAALDLLAEALLAHDDQPRGPELERFRLRFVERFQQLSGPATAKGIEDTAFYAYAPLLSRNEVGGGPEALLARAAADFHAGNARRAVRWPGGLLAVTTHDTKRTADVRSRLDVLSEIPAEWAGRLELWRRLNLPHKRTVRGRRRVPDPTTVLHMLQAMVAVWPVAPPGLDELDVLRERIGGYMEKAVREAKLRTTWTDPDESFEAALRSNVAALLDPARSPDFLHDILRFVTRIARAGYWNALGRTVLHLASPGIPDLYQGDELWNLGLVDPDNRRPVDFGVRRRLLEAVERGTAGGSVVSSPYLAELVDNPDDGRLKLHVIRAALAARNQRPPAFRSSAYLPLQAVGRSAGRVIAFGRGEGVERLVAVIPRFLAGHVLSGGGPLDAALWEDTVLPLPAGWPSRWTCALSGRTHQCDPGRGLRVPDLFGILPVALLLADYDS